MQIKIQTGVKTSRDAWCTIHIRRHPETQRPTSDIPSRQFPMPFSTTRNQGPDLEEGRDGGNPEHLGPESNEILKKKQAYHVKRL